MTQRLNTGWVVLLTYGPGDEVTHGPYGTDVEARGVAERLAALEDCAASVVALFAPERLRGTDA